ncbi:PEP-CTERM sorting domain-containing protein [Zoogloea sp.]|uniref:PEP-CTERM sorting domain-containing protein n=1 Tax=Zoogloea sp. TaxID=49181 RepID=UPI0035AE3C21
MHTPTLFKRLICCTLPMVAVLVMPDPAWTAVGGISDSAADTRTPVSEAIAPPATYGSLPTPPAPPALNEPDRLARMPVGPLNAPVAVLAPEPSALLLLAVGIGLLWLIRRKH